MYIRVVVCLDGAPLSGAVMYIMQMSDADADLWWLRFILFFNVLFGLHLFFAHIFTSVRMGTLPAFSFESQSVIRHTKPNVAGFCSGLRVICTKCVKGEFYTVVEMICLSAYFVSFSVKRNSFKFGFA
jgi:hypothetical protein